MSTNAPFYISLYPEDILQDSLHSMLAKELGEALIAQLLPQFSDDTATDFTALDDLEEGEILEDTLQQRLGKEPWDLGSTQLLSPTQDDAVKATEGKYRMRRSRWDEKDNYKQVEFLGEGGEGTCFLLQKRQNKEFVVCKVAPLRYSSDDGNPREVEILRDILPPNDRIVRFHDAILSSWGSQIYFDYYSGGDLSALMFNYHARDYDLPESFIWHTVLHLAEALAFLHYGCDRHSDHAIVPNWTPVVHRDIKPANIFLRLPSFDAENILGYPYPSIVLGDFGLATVEPSDQPVGTFVWQPPELPYASSEGDCWAAGAIIHAMSLQGDPPMALLPPHLADTHENREWWYYQEEAREVRSVYPYSRELDECMSGALIHDPSARFTALDLLDLAIMHHEDTDPENRDWVPLEPWAFEKYKGVCKAHLKTQSSESY